MLKGFQEQDFTVLRRSTHELLRNNRAEIAELKIFSDLNDQFGKGTLDILQFIVIQRSIDTILPPGTMLRHPSVDKMILDRMYPSNNRAEIAELKIFSNLNDQFGKGTWDILQFIVI